MRPEKCFDECAQVTPFRPRIRMIAVLAACALLASCASRSTAVAPRPASRPLDKSQPARTFYRNIRIFTSDAVSASFLDKLMADISRDLGVDCAYCHDPDALHISSLPGRKSAARAMIPVMWAIVARTNRDYFPGKGGPIRCWTCHRGSPVPARAGPRQGPLLREPRSGVTGGAAGKNLQVLAGLGRDELLATMRSMAEALGVECSACHEPGDRASDEKPLKVRAREMLAMTAAMDREHFEAGRGPTCWTCHQGSRTVPSSREAVSSRNPAGTRRRRPRVVSGRRVLADRRVVGGHAFPGSRARVDVGSA